MMFFYKEKEKYVYYLVNIVARQSPMHDALRHYRLL